jgi:lactoylglutathione lyase
VALAQISVETGSIAISSRGGKMAGICVVGVYVRDIQQAKEFYCDKLGFEITREYGDCILQLKNEGVTFIIEKIEGDFPIEPCITIGVPTNDLEKEMATLRKSGVTFIHDTPQQFPEGIFAACQDAEGNLVELIEFRE